MLLKIKEYFLLHMGFNEIKQCLMQQQIYVILIWNVNLVIQY